VVLRALRLIEAHPSVVSVEAQRLEGSDAVVATAEMKTELPNSWRAAGESPSGVRAIEPISFLFGTNYPVAAPVIRLRADFDRGHPHLQPGDPGDRPEPCLIAGSPRELLRTRGILGLVEQLAEWLERAAVVQLIDPSQGWEPTRRDRIDDVVIADSVWLTGLPSRDGGCHVFKFRYFAAVAEDGSASYWATLRKSIPLQSPQTSLTLSRTGMEADTVRAAGLVSSRGPARNPTAAPSWPAYTGQRQYPRSMGFFRVRPNSACANIWSRSSSFCRRGSSKPR
jgi:hypothetical protein